MTDKAFEERNRMMISEMSADAELKEVTKDWFKRSFKKEYCYHFTWLGLPIIQYPQDIVAVQELIWRTRPDVIVETGIARGGSLIFNASMLELLGGDGFVIGVDIDIRAHNKVAIEEHPMARRIKMIEGSSVADDIFGSVRDLVRDRQRVMVLLDSNHTHEHVLQELRLYSDLVKSGSYLVVFDTVIEDLPDDFFPDRPWQKGDNAMTAVRQFLAENDRFVVDDGIDDKLLISVAPGGYLRCVSD